MLRKFGILTLAAGLLALWPGMARADKLDKKLNETMPDIVKHVQSKGYKNVGILRFSAQKGNRPESYSLGPINGNMASRLENLLVVHGGDDKGPLFGVIHDAGLAAQDQKVGSWSSNASERAKLFGIDYPLAWGKEKVKADAFLTGKVALSPDLKKTTVTIHAFTKAALKPTQVAEFTVDTDASLVRDLGFNFALTEKQKTSLVRSRNPAEAQDELVLAQANQQNKQQQQNKLPEDKKPDQKPDQKPEDKKPEDKKPDQKPDQKVEQPKQPQQLQASPDNISGIALQIKSGTDAVEVKADSAADSKYQIECPAKGKPIVMSLTNKSDKQMAVVLKVAGMNTIFQEKDESVRCRKWVIPAGKTFDIKGFYQEKEAKHQPFAVLEGEDAQKAIADLGDKALFIQVDVFEDKEGTQPDMTITRGLSKARDRAGRADYSTLRTELLKQSGLKRTMVKGRSVIVPDTGEGVANPGLKEVDFAKNPLQVGSLTIRVAPREARQPDQPDQPKRDQPQDKKQKPDQPQPDNNN
jgi:hypothetical protein